MPPSRKAPRRASARAALLAVGLVAGFLVGGATPPPSAGPSATTSPEPTATPTAAPTATPVPTPRFELISVPLLAYYYIWFDPSSWDRAKSDLPLLGPYSSDDESIMRQHVAWARSAGLDGFIVSWKNTTVLDKRLDTLVRVARAANFKLEVIYEGLDFSRNPLPPTQVAEDLDFFIARYAADPVFDLLGKPVMILSGTWEFSTADVAVMAGARRDKLTILASERTAEDFGRLANVVDGNAYYWSSVNPDTSPDYADKLKAMGAAVHNASGFWFPPAAPGFDARLVGGTTVVDRQGGQMLQRQLDTAMGSFPDAIGLISWNEFSENSQIEPSKAYGDQSLKVIAELRKTNYTSVGDFDSSSPQGVDVSAGISRVVALVLVGGLGFGGALVLVRRRRQPVRRRRRPARR